MSPSLQQQLLPPCGDIVLSVQHRRSVHPSHVSLTYSPPPHPHFLSRLSKLAFLFNHFCFFFLCSNSLTLRSFLFFRLSTCFAVPLCQSATRRENALLCELFVMQTKVQSCAFKSPLKCYSSLTLLGHDGRFSTRFPNPWLHLFH